MNIAEAVQDYIDYLGEQNRSQSTSATYRYALERFLRFLVQEEEVALTSPLSAVTQEHVRRFGLHLYRLKLAASSRSTYLVVLRKLAALPGPPPGLGRLASRESRPYRATKEPAGSAQS